MSVRESSEPLPACHLCGGELSLLRVKLPEEQVTSDCRPWHGEELVAYCLNCGVLQKPVTKAWLEETQRIYDSYSLYEQGGGAEQKKFDTMGDAMTRSQRLVSWLSEHGQLDARGSLLDIGCGNGGFLRAFGSVNSGWTMTGLEITARNKMMIESISGVTHLHVGSVESLDKKFDLIVLVHALEHITNPIMFLRSLLGRLNNGGRLFIQVPDLLTSPFNTLLVFDHCSHFSADTLASVVRSSGYRVIKSDATYIPMELTLLAEPVTNEIPEGRSRLGFNNDDIRKSSDHIKWINQMLCESKQLPFQVGIFGTSISGTWLASALGDKAKFFVDEDHNRVGRTHLGLPIFSPNQVPSNIDILMPMEIQVANLITKRLAKYGLRFVYFSSVN